MSEPGSLDAQGDACDNYMCNLHYSASSSDEWSPPTCGNQRTNASLSSSSLDNIPLAELVSMDSTKRRKGYGSMQRKLRKERSEKRRKGETYRTSKGKEILSRPQKPLLDSCRSKCKTKLTDVDLKITYRDYRKLPSRDAQKQHLSAFIVIMDKQRERKNSNTKNRQISVQYKFDNHGKLIDLCKTCFSNIYGEGPGFINYLISLKKKSESNIVTPDSRGRHPPGTKRNDKDIAYVNDHIRSFPCYISHYSRRHTEKKYLGCDMSLKKMYNLYTQKLNLEKPVNVSDNAVRLGVYRGQFSTHNLKFKKPAIDTCKTCDAFDMKIKSCHNAIEKNILKINQAEHHVKADFHYETKRSDKVACITSDGKLVTASFDLQKCLETPCLSTSVSFYKRKLWTFNLTVRNCLDKKTSCFMWHEGTAQRGANEIASCLYKFIMALPDTVETLVFYSDTCPGQNRNSILPVMFMYVIKKKQNLKEIHHKFLVPGHTHLKCDTDHAAIERFKKKHNVILSIPQDWMNLVRMVSSNYVVHSMSQNDFFSFSNLLTNVLVKRNIDSQRQPFNWNNIFWVKVTKKFGEISFKYSLNSEETFRMCSLNRRGRLLDAVKLPLAYSEPLVIEEKKYKDLLDLIQFLDPVYRDFYVNLRHDNRLTATVSDSEDDFNSSEQ